MSLISKSKLFSYRNSTRDYGKSLNESLNEFKNESRYNKATIFLSHKHDEIEELDSAISFLKSFGVEIYVDWQDEQMPFLLDGVIGN